MQKKHQQNKSTKTKRNKKKKQKKKALITEKKRAKEKRNRVTRSESPSRSPIKKGNQRREQATGLQIYPDPQTSAYCVPSKCTTSNTAELDSKC